MGGTYLNSSLSWIIEFTFILNFTVGQTQYGFDMYVYFSRRQIKQQITRIWSTETVERNGSALIGEK